MLHEHTINDAVAAVLRKTRHAWHTSDVVSSENTGMLKGTHKRPDILVLESNVSPVVIETEVAPAASVESDAVSRLGQRIKKTGREILSSLAVRLPDRLRTTHPTKLYDAIAGAPDLEIALFVGRSASASARWPQSGWINGSVADLSLLAQSASVPPEVIEEAADRLVIGVSEAAGLLSDIAAAHPGATKKISEELRQEDGEQTQRMAATILANAFVFQETLAGGAGKLADIMSLDELRGKAGGFSKSAVLSEWRKILTVNYWPIFDIARRILEQIPAAAAKPLIERMAETADDLLKSRLMRSHDLTGAVFQRLIADRKFLAAYYTTPASAALLVGLAITPENPPGDGTWAKVDTVKSLRIADFACGTGTLLSTAYQRIGQLHELAGGDAEALHPEMMANALIGCDVLPAAAHLTASMLAGAHPTVKYTRSSILTVAYGKQPGGGIALGSLDLLNSQGSLDIIEVAAKAAEGMGEAETSTWRTLPDVSFDAVIMNPPFTRATGHEGKKIGVPNPMFAAFSSSEEEQRLMSRATQRLTQGTSAHGNAGEASIFLVLADRKLKPGGSLALVMPLSLVAGDAWEASRKLIAEHYGGLVVASIAGTDDAELSFSADTGMGECLLVGRRSTEASGRATFVILNERPAFALEGAHAAKAIHHLIASESLRRLEDGPVGGTPIHFGNDVIGHAVDAPLPAAGGWNVSRIADLALAQSAYQVSTHGRLWLPGMTKAGSATLPVTTVAVIGKIGPYHSDINGKTADGGIRGPFTIGAAMPHTASTYPTLWAHDATREHTMVFPADSEGLPLKGSTRDEQKTIDEKVAEVWATASHCHFNQNFQFNSQPTGMQFTPRRSIGGRAWLSIQLSSSDHEKALVLWANTSLGLLLYWWHANKQQIGRGSIGKAALASLPILNVAELTPEQLHDAVNVFDTMSNHSLLPLHEIDKDLVRKELDEQFARDVLRLKKSVWGSGGALELLRMKLAREPSIRGHKTISYIAETSEVPIAAEGNAGYGNASTNKKPVRKKRGK
jgi:hypothetical protein